ncbi:heat shock protein Hsp20 [Caballeronia arationis]|nr:heat shock protein Hsp20 [Caballeronia arationis]
MSDLYFGTDLFSDFDRLQRQMASLFGGFPSSIRSGRFGAFPAGQHRLDRRLD